MRILFLAIFSLLCTYSHAQLDPDIRLGNKTFNFFTRLAEMPDFSTNVASMLPVHFTLVVGRGYSFEPGSPVIDFGQDENGRILPLQYHFHSIYGSSIYFHSRKSLKNREGFTILTNQVVMGKGSQRLEHLNLPMAVINQHLNINSSLAIKHKRMQVNAALIVRYLDLKRSWDWPSTMYLYQNRSFAPRFNMKYVLTQNQTLGFNGGMLFSEGLEEINGGWGAYTAYSGSVQSSFAELSYELRRKKDRIILVPGVQHLRSGFPFGIQDLSEWRVYGSAGWDHREEQWSLHVNNEFRYFGNSGLQPIPEISFIWNGSDHLSFYAIAASNVHTILQNYYLFSPHAFAIRRFLLLRENRGQLALLFSNGNWNLSAQQELLNFQSEVPFALFESPTGSITFLRQKLKLRFYKHGKTETELNYIYQKGLNLAKGFAPAHTLKLDLKIKPLLIGTIRNLDMYLQIDWAGRYTSSQTLYFLNYNGFSSRKVDNLLYSDFRIQLDGRKSNLIKMNTGLSVYNMFDNRRMELQNFTFMVVEGVNYLPAYEVFVKVFIPYL